MDFQRTRRSAQTSTSLSCESALYWINTDQKIYSLASTFQINLFSSVGSGCTPGELRVSAVFIDHNDEVVCSGVVENVAIVDQNTQTIFLEFKPLVPLEFVRGATACARLSRLPSGLFALVRTS